MNLSTLSEWLTYIASIHTQVIDLGLARVKTVAQKLDLLSPPCPVVMVGGTNGKGSTVAGLEAIYRAADYRTGAFTSPFLFKHNEEVRIDGVDASDDLFCEAFSKIEEARGDISLTLFEFNTLAALFIFKKFPLDIWILEVGLGGRLDAVNILDADVAIVTSISIDHVEWLGDTREKIAIEKAGIFRKNHPAVCGDIDPPVSLIEYARQHQVPLFCQGKDFFYLETENTWSFHYGKKNDTHLPRNTLSTQNMASVLMAITLLQPRLPVSIEKVQQGLQNTKLIGRIQIIEGPIIHIYDVAHNAGSVALLAKRLKEMPCQGKTRAVFSMLADKDIQTCLQEMCNVIDIWYVAPLTVKRGASEKTLKEYFEKMKMRNVYFYSSIQAAYEAAKNKAIENDRIIVFGSFHTVSEVQAIL